jgi:hypothetical protein
VAIFALDLPEVTPGNIREFALLGVLFDHDWASDGWEIELSRVPSPVAST